MNQYVGHNPDKSSLYEKKNSNSPVSKLKNSDFERIHKQLLDESHNLFKKEKRQNLKWGGGANEHPGTKLHTGNLALPVVFNEMITKSGHNFNYAIANKNRQGLLGAANKIHKPDHKFGTFPKPAKNVAYDEAEKNRDNREFVSV